MNVTVVGVGYVGLITGVCLAKLGNHVVCYDIDDRKVEKLNNGEVTIHENGLKNLLSSVLEEEFIQFTSNALIAYDNADIIIIAVGTPENSDGSANLTYIEQAADEIALNMKEETVVVIKSTVPVGTNAKIKSRIKNKTNKQFYLASNPEFLREGSAIHDFFQGDRIVLGTEEEHVKIKLDNLYSPLNIPILHTDIRSAEMIKYASNAFLATKISFINEIANICEKVGANINSVSKGVGLDRRIGSHFLQAGIGYGGSCFPKDTKSLVQIAGDVNHRFHLLEAVINVNAKQQKVLLHKAKVKFGNLIGKQVAVLGLAFKPNTDDIREAASIVMVEELIKEGAIVKVYDPIAIDNFKQIGFHVQYCKSIELCISGADMVFILTEWDEIASYPIEEYAKYMNNPVIFDGRNCILDLNNNDSVEYIGIGYSHIEKECTIY
ncbi:UDP-glucose dehydrogenase family protein [Bacillus alkalisoli]|uniref:UDP-glucose dehydrogenase family protein n=1 Tax=Bacillus alkalisoli TaxID=2011008 RepID=UPI000C234985|nr:UDP-glucose/GDP-mannose dehydrogenase family protein [Bacillus alkalisoli]